MWWSRPSLPSPCAPRRQHATGVKSDNGKELLGQRIYARDQLPTGAPTSRAAELRTPSQVNNRNGVCNDQLRGKLTMAIRSATGQRRSPRSAGAIAQRRPPLPAGERLRVALLGRRVAL